MSSHTAGEVTSNEWALVKFAIALLVAAIIFGAASIGLPGSSTGQASDPLLVNLKAISGTVARTLLLVALAPLAVSVTLSAMRSRR